MSGETAPTDDDGVAQLSEPTTSTSLVPRASTWAVWALFLCSIGVLVLAARRGAVFEVAGYLRVDGLTTVLWTVVTFFSGIVHSYSRRYMAGDRYLDRFYYRVFAFTLAVATLAAADHVALFAAAWLAMGLLMASLIGHVRDWEQARAAGALARRYFLASSAVLAASLAVLVWATGATSISGIFDGLESVSRTTGLVAAGGLVLAAIIQSALLPFHGWLLSSMTAPTPASALMHAGFVNAGGVLLTRFAPVVGDHLAVMSAIVVLGAISALLGQAMILVQSNVKRELGCSTMAQMGFMILQCGLGFFAAAIAHLILHGFYKAYLFLSSGAGVEQTVPKTADRTPLGFPGIAVSLVTAVGGGVLFGVLTGKVTSLEPNSGTVLTLVVVLTTLTAARDILRRSTLPTALRYVSVPLVVLTAIGGYAVAFNAVSTMLSGVPMTYVSTEMTAAHYLVVGLFAVAYLAVELGWLRSSERLYVALLNLSKPDPTTLLTDTEDYHDV
ncbi:proton-conducting transporter membrane subunit [Natrinema sp. 1APR25-10V2]|uniref:proton-conducting transporter transmembrane domain-containing protein n=1 Tax=Natrinema sp. 1APR25-10V2 TaxID=2951081 RepID=UPI002874E6D4|nr:proton-conducting transporter membrane subunit [Natrinema sp. 1APR25-10V2]MDS0475941.1 oxidoreductase [Natrinema sp. 1APR25-10V2]